MLAEINIFDYNPSSGKIENKRNELVEKINKRIKQKNRKNEEYLKLYENTFEWRFEFPEVLDEEGNFTGFDVVTGNPPYMLLDNKVYNSFYIFIKGNSNTYVAFIELALKLMKDKSSYAMIIPNTWLAGNNFFELRKHLVNEKILKRIIQLPYDIFEVYVDTVILILEKGFCSYTVEYYKFSVRDRIDMNFNLNNIDINSWQDENLTIFLDNDLLRLLPKYRNNSIRLSDVAKVQRGTLPPKTVQLKDKPFKNSIKWFSGQVYRYIFSEDEKEYFVDYNQLLENKHRELFKAEKIIGRQLISRQFRLQFTYSSSEYAFKKNLYAIYDLDKTVFSYLYLLGILNSKLFSFIQVKSNASGQRDDYPALSLLDYKNFLIKLTDNNKQQKLSNLVDEILKQKKQNPKADTVVLEKQIDEMVYKLYELTEEEIKIVEGK